MLKSLSLKNLILIEEVEIAISEGLNIITGETGAGKTALITALKLLLGERADPQKVRKGCEKALIQAVFALPQGKAFWEMVEELPLTLSQDEDLILTREVNKTGKSRAFISGQQVPAAILQRLSPYLFDFIGQHAHIELKNLEKQREYLDLFAKVDTSLFQSLWAEEKEWTAKIKKLTQAKVEGEGKRRLLEERLKELQEANVQEGEEDSLFEEFSLLNHVQELAEGATEVIGRAEEAMTAMLPSEKLLEKLSEYDSSLAEAKEGARESHLQLQELILTLQSYRGKLENNPQRIKSVEERLQEVVSLKKKYGENLREKQTAWENELDGIENLDEEIENASRAKIEFEEKANRAALELTETRKAGASDLQNMLESHLKELNIPKAKVDIRCGQAPRSKTGEDEIAFHLYANVGEESVSVKENMSGGELSRVFFALKIALAEPVSMIFDEIDANVGGETAAVVGKKLAKLAEKRQVICITHFPQVAQFADHHLRVVKEEVDGRTVGRVESLSPEGKEEELIRMRGGHAIV